MKEQIHDRHQAIFLKAVGPDGLAEQNYLKGEYGATSLILEYPEMKIRELQDWLDLLEKQATLEGKDEDEAETEEPTDG